MAQLLLARGANSLVGDRAYDTTPYGWTYYLETSKDPWTNCSESTMRLP